MAPVHGLVVAGGRPSSGAADPAGSHPPSSLAVSGEPGDACVWWGITVRPAVPAASPSGSPRGPGPRPPDPSGLQGPGKWQENEESLTPVRQDTAVGQLECHEVERNVAGACRCGPSSAGGQSLWRAAGAGMGAGGPLERVTRSPAGGSPRGPLPSVSPVTAAEAAV